MSSMMWGISFIIRSSLILGLKGTPVFNSVERILHLKVHHYLLGLIFDCSDTLYLINMATNEEIQVPFPKVFVNPSNHSLSLKL